MVEYERSKEEIHLLLQNENTEITFNQVYDFTNKNFPDESNIKSILLRCKDRIDEWLNNAKRKLKFILYFKMKMQK